MINCLNTKKLFWKLKRFPRLVNEFHGMTGYLISSLWVIFDFFDFSILCFFILFDKGLILISFWILKISLIFLIRKFIFRLYFQLCEIRMSVRRSGSSMRRNVSLFMLIIFIAPITWFFIIQLERLKKLLIFLLIFMNLFVLIRLLISLLIGIGVHFLHFDSIEILLSTIIMFNLTFSTVIFVAINFIGIGLSKIWVEVIIILPYLIISIILMNFIWRLLINFRLDLFLRWLFLLFLILIIFIIYLLPFLVVWLLIIRSCDVFIYLLKPINLTLSNRFLLSILKSIWCSLLFYWIILLHLRQRFFSWETTI